MKHLVHYQCRRRRRSKPSFEFDVGYLMEWHRDIMEWVLDTTNLISDELFCVPILEPHGRWQMSQMKLSAVAVGYRFTSLRLLQTKPNLELVCSIEFKLVYGCSPYCSFFGIASLIISDLLTLTLSSNAIYKLTCSLVQAFLAPNNSIHALLIRHNHVDFCIFKLYYVMHYYVK